MADKEQYDLLRQDVEAWNQWRRQHPKIQPKLSRANFFQANLSGANLSDAILFSANLSGANLRGADLTRANLSEADLSQANLRGANLSRVDLARADLSGADISYTNLTRAHLREANLSQANLREAALLDGADLSGTKLFQAHLNLADLRGVDLSHADLSEADLSEANLTRAHLYFADLTRAKLKGVDLSGADFNKVTLKGADFSKARMIWTTFGNIDLSTVKGLETVEHDGPSTIGIDTIYRSHGNIPEIFLKGAGVDDTFITYIRSLVGKAIEYYSCFISYSSKDDAFARRLHADLQSHNVRCWFAPVDMKTGDWIRDRIDESIRVYDKFLLILSEHSVLSEWVEDEVEAAMERERLARERGEERAVLFPVCLDGAVKTTTKAWAAKLRRQRHIGDFTKWKNHNAYQKAFDCLLRDLKAEA